MRKIRKLCFVLSLLLVLSFFIAAPAFAADLINTTDINEFRDSGTLRISYRVDGIPIYVLDKGELTVTIQRYSGSSWVSVSSKTVTEYNTSNVDNDRDYTVSVSGSYRLKMYFYAEDEGETDSYTRYSSAISVD
jgi:hypothetical protein